MTKSSGTTAGTSRRRQIAAILMITVGVVLANVSVSRTARAASSVVAAWTTPAQINAALSDVPPGMVEYNGALYAAWSGEASPNELIYASYSGGGWDTPAVVPSAFTNPGATPALAVFNSKLYLFSEGQKTSSTGLWYTAFNGKTWSTQTRVPSALT